jgi:hypothetical protein
MKRMLRMATIAFAAIFLVAMPGVPASAVGDHCPDDAAGNDAGPGAPPGAVNGASGSITVDGVTVSWDGTSVTVSGGTATFCVKGGTSGNTGVITRGPGTYSTGSLGLTGPQGQSQEVSYLIVYEGVYPPTDASTELTSGTGTVGFDDEGGLGFPQIALAALATLGVGILASRWAVDRAAAKRAG